MTVHNYIPRADPYIQGLISNRNILLPEDTKNTIRYWWSRILDQETVKFTTPLNGELFDDNLRGLSSQLNLPYERIAIEHMTHHTSGVNFGEIIYAEKMDSQFIRIISFMQIRHAWNPNYFESRLFSTFNLANPGEISILLPYPHSRSREHDIKEYYRARAVRTVLELIEALSCHNVYMDTLIPSQRQNRHRVSQGRLPLLEYKVLTIDCPTSHSRREYLGGLHRSPRYHLRRGHVRIYNRGSEDEFRVWINSMIINRNSSNRIIKEYEIV